jgi:hypothetical protein
MVKLSTFTRLEWFAIALMSALTLVPLVPYFSGK